MFGLYRQEDRKGERFWGAPASILLGPIFKPSALPPFLLHILLSQRRRAAFAAESPRSSDLLPPGRGLYRQEDRKGERFWGAPASILLGPIFKPSALPTFLLHILPSRRRRAAFAAESPRSSDLLPPGRGLYRQEDRKGERFWGAPASILLGPIFKPSALPTFLLHILPSRRRRAAFAAESPRSSDLLPPGRGLYRQEDRKGERFWG